MTIIYVGENEPIEIALKRFRKKCEQSGIKRELKKRAFYMKPSLTKKLKREAAQRRIARQKRKQNRRAMRR